MILAFLAAVSVHSAFDPELIARFEPDEAERQAEETGAVTVKIRDTKRATTKVVQSETVVHAPASVVWSVVTDYDFYPKIFDRMEKSETWRKEGDWEDHYTVVRYPWPYGPRWVVNTIHHDKDTWTARFRRLEGSIREVEGIWELREKGKDTYLRYGVRIDPGLPFLPKWVILWGTRTAVPEILKSVAKEAEKRSGR